MVSDLDKKILMELQYRFPLTETPYTEIAERLEIKFEDLKKRIEALRSNFTIKRIGFNINYKASGKVAALVAIRIPDPNAKETLRKILLKDPEVTHNYVRNHEVYNIWFVIKRKSIEDLMASVEEIAKTVGSKEYLVLLGKRTYKLSVKFDLYKGISWSEPEVLPEKIPTFEELGLRKEPFSELAKWIPVTERPYREVAAKYGYKEEELVGLIRELYKKRVLRNIGATLEGSRVGIVRDGMVVLKGSEEDCLRIALEIPEATHVVYRVPLNGEWEHRAYFMAHADSEEKIEGVAKKASRIIGDKDYRILYSVENLKPGTHSNE
ncbi:AsnC family transcriptional regulator [Desulfurococcaceae archaeon AG1]|jgi:DNA-binding Lrp family transcriptional regulator|nr:AsnC family transcriptional regulator [Desulfurococcaceae archaeon AG1]